MFNEIRKLILLFNLLKNTSIKELAKIYGLKEEKKLLLTKANLLILESKLAEMKAENYQRQLKGYSLAYEDFSEIITNALEVAYSLSDDSKNKYEVNKN